MNRNTELHFGNVPKIHQQRSKFDMSHSLKTTFNAGEVIPLEVSEILPGDTVTMDMAHVVRMATPIYPVMDNMILDIYWFFVPNRLVWEHWEEFWGENEDPWTQQIEYEIPQIKAPKGGWKKGSIADYMGIPTYVENLSVSALPGRAYAKIWSDWFRDENLKNAAHMYVDDTTRTGSNGNNYVTDAELYGMPAKAAKLHDYFTSALPSPQKGPSVGIPLGTTALVYTGENHNINKPGETTKYPMNWGTYNINTMDETNFTYDFQLAGFKTNSSDNKTAQMQPYNDVTIGTPTNAFAPKNLYADLTNATAATINQLRTAFAIQKYYEAAGRFGTKYIEFLRGVFGVESSDARLQRSEYLGGIRTPINMDCILQTSSTDSVSPQGNASGYSVTRGNNSMFTKSFEEHGHLVCLAVARVEHSYQQGLNRMWSRKKWTDYYNPFFANLGEQPITNKEIYAQGNEKDDEVFGYQEAWADYRYRPNTVTGAMRSNNPTGSLDAWHYADDYETLPKLGSAWIDEGTENVDRTLAVTSQIENQFIGDFYFKTAYTRCMPIYSVPGLIDHV